LENGTEFWATVNARTGTAGGGPGSPAVSATPRLAGETWTTTTLGTSVNALGFGLIEHCRTVNAVTDTDRPATGHFIAVGDAASIFTSLDGVNWTKQAVDPSFTADLQPVDVYTRTPGDLRNLAQTLLAVGVAPATHRFSTFVGVGDGGRIAVTSDTTTWIERESPTTENLNYVTHNNGSLLAVGDNGTLLMSGDSNGWGRIDIGTTAHLRGAAWGNN